MPIKLKSVFYCLFVLSAFFFYAGCSDNSGVNEDKDSISDSVPEYATGKAMLGPLQSATVEVFSYDNFKIPLYTTKSSDSPALSEAGTFQIPKAVFEDDTLYVVRVSGGIDIDADDDGEADQEPTINKGSFHAAALGKDFKDNAFNVTALTEVAYRHSAYHMMAEFPPGKILEKLESAIQVLFKEDVDGDEQYSEFLDRPIYTMSDLMKWSPQTDKEKLTIPWAKYVSLIDKIHQDSKDLYKLSLEIEIESELAWGNNPIGNGNFVSRRGIYHFQYDLAVSGDYLFHVTPKGLETTYISDPSHPINSSNLKIPGHPSGIAIQEKYAFVVTVEGVFYVIDIKDPLRPEIMNQTNLDARLNDIVVHQGYAYVWGDEHHLFILDIHDPLNASLTDSVSTPEEILDVARRNSILYLAVGDSGLLVLDISNPASPVVKHSLQTQTRAEKINLSGNFLLVSPRQDLNSFPVQPGWYCHPDGTCEEIFDTVYEVFDINDVSQPYSMDVVRRDKFDRYPSNILFVDNYAYATDERVTIYDFTDPLNPSQVGSTEQDILITLLMGWRSEPIFSEGFLYVATNELFETYIFDVNDPNNPEFLLRGSHKPNHNLATAGFGNHVLRSDCSSGQVSVNTINDDNTLSPISQNNLQGWPVDISVNGQNAYVASGPVGLQVIDISDALNPGLTGAINTPGWATHLFSSGEKIYIADGGMGLHVIDVSDSSHPFIEGTLNLPGWAYEIAISGTKASLLSVHNGYPENTDLSNAYYRLQIVDVHSSGNPVLLGGMDFEMTSPAPSSISASGDQVYFVNHGTVEEIDIRNPSNPEYIITLETFDSAKEISLSGSYLYVADGERGMTVINIKNPADPYIIGRTDTTREFSAEKISITENDIYLGNDSTHVERFRVIQRDIP